MYLKFVRCYKKAKESRSINGQISIFIALVFQIMFVFFAMLINISLIIHDKINLQNAVDLAAYYAAEKQAEQLNEIAHINYQIRQDYKLLAFRIHVLGSMGSNSAAFNQSAPPPDAALPNTSPVVCVSNSAWTDGSWGDSTHNPPPYCVHDNMSFPGLPAPRKSNSLLGFITGFASNLFTKAASNITEGCNRASDMNWSTAAIWNYIYRRATKRRLEMITTIANNLSDADFKDRNGDPIKIGALQTFKKNLTEANLRSIEDAKEASFEVYNGLVSPPGTNKPPEWLQIIPITPSLTYTRCNSSTNAAATTSPDYIQNPPTTYGPILTALGGAAISKLVEYTGQPASGLSIDSATIGVEKNPWHLAYVAVRASTKPRKPFAPFGKPIQLVARAYAMPFGGRIGPWYASTWGNGSTQSTGAPIDALVNSRDGGAPPASPIQAIPNYSRYPGDSVGIRSGLAQYLFKSPLIQANTKNLQSYIHFMSPNFDKTGDVLSTDPKLRLIEAAGVAPDAFDISYYSIDPEYYTDYLNNMNPNRFALSISDIGSDLQATNNNPKNFSVGGQLRARKSMEANFQTLNPWLVYKLDHLLTAWSQDNASNYSPSPSNFQTCYVHPYYSKTNPSESWPVQPGFCIAGGRTGYSVKIVSGSYLKSSELELGGTGVKSGIDNPPPF